MDIGAAAFWLFLAAIIVGGMWRKKHSEAMRHETVRVLIEKNVKIDEAQLKELLNPTPQPAPEWLVPKHKPGTGFRVLRISGAIILCIALGLGMMAIWRGIMLGFYDRSVLEIGTAIPLVTMIGIGLFVASRFVPRPPSNEN
jgi:hypothetical protein